MKALRFPQHAQTKTVTPDKSKLIATMQDWPSPAASDYDLVPLRVHQFTSCSAQFGKLPLGFLALLCQPGHIVWNKNDGNARFACRYVLDATAFGATVVCVQSSKVGTSSTATSCAIKLASGSSLTSSI